MYDCIVVGAGAAGMSAAIFMSRMGLNCTIIEHTSRAGSKLLQTGNGKCNLTNKSLESEYYYCEDKTFVQSILSAFDYDSLIEFFQSLGIYTYNRNGYIYPRSQTAASVRDAFLFEIQKSKVKINYDNEIKDIIKNSDSYKIILDNGYELESKTVLFAAGLCAAPKTGSDGSILKIIEKLGIHVNTPLPALVPLCSDSSCLKRISGTRIMAIARFTINGKQMIEEYGEIQFTDYGLSGIPIFQISHGVISALKKGGKCDIIIDPFYDYSEEELADVLEKIYQSKGKNDISAIYNALINANIAEVLIERANLSRNTDLSSEDFKKLSKSFKNLKFRITGHKDFDMAQVSQGGVDIKELHSLSLESKKNKGIYFAGEIIDVDGICGGYNLSWAFSSAHYACEAINKSLGRKG